MNFVKVPNLPKNPVKALVLGQKYSEILEKELASRHVLAIFAPDNPDVDSRMSGHADLSVLHLGGNRLLVAKYLENSTFFQQLQLEPLGAEISVSKQIQGSQYPRDANLNVCIAGKRVIYNPKTADDCIANLLTNSDVLKLTCRQGYARCAVCVVDEHSIITADNGIATVAQRAGLYVLMVKPELTELCGFGHGFIGGATFKLSAYELAFTGRLSDENEQNRIENFLRERNVKPIYLTDARAFDMGSAIPLIEY